MHSFSLALCSAVCLAATVALSTGGHSAVESQASDSLSRRGVRPAASFHPVSSPAPSSPDVSSPAPSSPDVSSPAPSSPVVSSSAPFSPDVTSSAPSSPDVTSSAPSSLVVSSSAPSSPDVTSSAPSSPGVTSSAPSSPDVTSSAPSSPDVSSSAPSSPDVTSSAPSSPVVSSSAPSSPDVTSSAPSSPDVTSSAPSSPDVTSSAPSSPDVSSSAPSHPVVSSSSPSFLDASSPVAAFPVPLPPPPSWPCFRDESIPCTCRGSTANCSHAHGRLSYIPAFPRNITTLIFSFNNLTSIATAEFFLNVTQLVSLNMSHNGLGSIHAEAFEPLTKLQVLDLSFNDLNYSELSAVFAAPNVKELYVRHMQLGPLPRDYFHRTPSAQLTVLDLGGNPIKSLNLSVLAPLKVLTRLSCASCKVASIASDHLPNLSRLQLQDNVLQDLPDSCRDGSSLFPSLQCLNLKLNSICGFTSSDICLPNLEYLNLGRNRISEVEQDMFNGKYFPRLAHLDLSGTQPITTLEQYAFRNPTLQALSLKNCYIMFSDETIHPDCFAGMPSLRGLELSHNLGSYIPDQKLNRLFAPVTSVEKLYLGSWDMQNIRSNPFGKMTKLRVLELYRNKLDEIPDGAFDLHTHLTDLVISDNQLQAISSSMFNAATSKRLRHLDFSGNPLLCDCDLLWFKDWFVSSPALFNGSYRDYTCANLNYTRLQVFSLREQVCFFSRETYTFLISSISLFVATLALACTCYPYRWHVRLVLYEAFRGREGEAQRRRRLETGRFDYDVFVSYAHEDQAWVRRHLMPELEGRLGLRLCVHERDFTPGRNIVDNIVESVAASKKVLVLFSRDFVASHWCQFELNLCLSHVMEHGDALLVTCLGDVTSLDGVTNAMLAVLKVTTYIQWEDSAAARASFWGRLRLAMGEILPPAQRHV